MSTSVQLLWMGILAIVVAGLSEFVDDNDRFFTPNIGEITAFEWSICIGIAFIGKPRIFHIQRETSVLENIIPLMHAPVN